MKRQIQQINFKHEETVGRLDRHIKRSELMDVLDRKQRELENEIGIAKSL